MSRHPSPDAARRPPPALDEAALERLALRYVERFATTRAKLAAYLTRKLRERGWAGATPADPGALAERMAQLGYVDDRGFAEARAAAMARRGLGARRVRQDLRAAGIDQEDAGALAAAIDERALAAALAFARRRRVGPYRRAGGEDDRALRDRQMAAMIRAGHAPDLARRVLALLPGAIPGEEQGDADAG